MSMHTGAWWGPLPRAKYLALAVDAAAVVQGIEPGSRDELALRLSCVAWEREARSDYLRELVPLLRTAWGE